MKREGVTPKNAVVVWAQGQDRTTIGDHRQRNDVTKSGCCFDRMIGGRCVIAAEQDCGVRTHPKGVGEAIHKRGEVRASFREGFDSRVVGRDDRKVVSSDRLQDRKVRQDKLRSPGFVLHGGSPLGCLRATWKDAVSQVVDIKTMIVTMQNQSRKLGSGYPGHIDRLGSRFWSVTTGSSGSRPTLPYPR